MAISGTSTVTRRTFIKVPDRISTGGPTQVKAGFPSGSSNVDKAIWNEFGTRGGGWGGPIPERPFMRNAMRDNRAKYLAAMKRIVESILTGKITMHAALQRLGIMAADDIKESITSLTTPANSPVTIALKGSSKPLIDTGEMRQSVTHRVE